MENQRFDSPLTMPPQKRGRHGHMDCFLRAFERIYEFLWNSDLKPSQVKKNTIRIDLRLNQRDTPTGQTLVLPDSDTLTRTHSAWRPQGCMTESYTSYICCREIPRFCIALENRTIGTPKITGTTKLSCLHVIHFQFGRNSLSSRIHKHSSKYLRSPRFSWHLSDFQALSLFAPQATSSSCNWTCQVFWWPDLGIIGDNCMYYPTHLQAKPRTNNLSCEAALLFWVFCLAGLWVHLCWVVQRCNDFRELQETWHNRPPEGIISIMSRYVFCYKPLVHWRFHPRLWERNICVINVFLKVRR